MNSLYGEFPKDVTKIRGNHEGYDYCIFSDGAFPRAYVFLKPGHSLYGVNDLGDVRGHAPHGGFTYLGPFPSADDTWALGWDYAHLGDYHCMVKGHEHEGKKWTEDEIKKEIFEIIEALKECE